MGQGKRKEEVKRMEDRRVDIKIRLDGGVIRWAETFSTVSFLRFPCSASLLVVIRREVSGLELGTFCGVH